MIGRADEHVADVEQKAAAGAARDLAQKIRLRPGAFGEDDIGGRIFEQDRATKRGLRLVDMLRHKRERLVRIGQGEEIVEERALVRRPGEVLGNEGRLEAPGDCGESLQMGAVERPGRADRQADAVQGQGVALPDRVEAAVRRAAGAHVVFRVDFEKPKLWPRFDDRLEMLGLEPDADGSSAKPPCKPAWRTRVRDGHGFLQGLVRDGTVLATSLARQGVLHRASRVIRASMKIFLRICNGRRNEAKPV